MIEIASATRSDNGPRPTNEDRCASNVPEPETLRRKGALFALADGLGGHEGGEIASDTALRTLLEQYYSPLSHPRIEAALQRAVQAANLAVFSLAEREPRYRSMATTLDALVVTPSLAYVAHVGDSRVYRLRAGTLRRMTEDHSEVAQLVRMRLVSPERSRDHPRRNVLTRTVGSGLIVRLCSDGLWASVEEREIAQVMREENADHVCTTLVELALTHGADDNVTAQVIEVTAISGEAALPPEADSRGGLRRLARRFLG